jgi:protein-S-isoprenylcysteine O-methyltransferase Ste14/NAD-dependent dihydropyrimidine dehydrogenase PreA subunit
LPIDANFQKSRRRVGKEGGVTVWGPVDPPEKLGIRGTYVAVDWDICDGCGKCVDVCPMHVYEWMETSGHPRSKRKALPTRESKCVQCYRCEVVCPAQAIRVTFGGPPGWEGAVALLVLAHIIVGVAYGTLFGPCLGIEILRYVGWIIGIISVPFFFSPMIYFSKKGMPQEGKGLMDTTVIVDSGTYSIVRHPQILGCIMLISASILVSQHWLSVVIGIPLIVWACIDIPNEEKGLILKFGDPYRHYMQEVPRLNFVVGVVRLLKHRER